MKNYGKLVTPDFFSASTRMDKWNCVEGESLDLLKKVELQLCRLAPENDYGYRHLWLAVPRGDISQWCTKREWDEYCVGTDCGEQMEYEEHWKDEYPLETMWFKLEYAGYPKDDYHSIHIIDGRNYNCAIVNRDNGICQKADMTGFLTKLHRGVAEIVDDICADPQGYNAYIESHLPPQYRYGRIARKDLDRIAPFCRLDIKNPELAKTVLRKIIAGEFSPVKDFTIRDFLKYYHVAVNAFDNSLLSGLGQFKSCEPTDDVSFYIHQHGDHFEGLDLDDPKDLDKFDHDHYGEIHLTRLDILVDNYHRDGTLICVDCSYASMIDYTVNVAVALYQAGAPLEMFQAETMLAAVEGTDDVRICPDTYHNYLGSDCEGCGGSVEIPFEYELDSLKWTRESLQEFIAAAKWDELDTVKPLESACK